MPAKKRLRPLTPKQQCFVNEYVIDWNATRAGLAAGYSKASVRSTMCTYLTQPNIQKAIEEKKRQIRAKNEDKVSRIRENLEAVAYNEAETTRDRLKALELLGKTEAMFSDKLIVTPEIPCLSPEETLRLRQQASIIDSTPRRKLVDNVDAVVV